MTDYQKLVEHSNAGMFICENEKFIYVNDAFVHITGFHSDRSLQDLMSSTSYIRLLEALNDKEQMSASRLLLKCQHQQGYALYLEVSVKRLTQHDQERIYGTIIDQTHWVYNNKQKDTESLGIDKCTLWGDFPKAMTENQFYLEYQPRISLKENKVTSVEALLRWNHPIKGLIPPSKFIPIAEETGLIKDLGKWVLQTALREMKSIMKSSNISVSINVSMIQIMEHDFIFEIKQALALNTFDPSRLELEITETALYHSEELMRDFIKEISALNIQVSLDDFGVGYSSLNFIHMFEIDTVKLDRFFMRFIMEEKNRKIFSGVVSLLQSLHMKIVAEGIETKEQYEYLLKYDCEEAQGYLFSKPVPIHELKHVIEDITKKFKECGS